MNIKEQDLEELLTRGVDEVIDRSSLEKKLKSGKKLRVKFGIDPTSPSIHLGRSIPLLKLRDFQKLGHKIILIIGDFTGLIGDTSDKDSERPMLTEKEVKTNLKTYIEQAGKIIDSNKAEVCYNGKWLSKLGYVDIGNQANIFSLNEFISRENISKRIKAGKRVSLREVLYPLMQGYDSVEVEADIEIGGTDQRFNLLAGRDIQRFYGKDPQDILTNPLIEGLDGKKMSSSTGNTINFLDTANDMFGKVMSINDDLIIKYFTLLTRVDYKKIDSYKQSIEKDRNHRDIKIELATEIVKMYHSQDVAITARDYFINTFSKKEIPKDIPKFKPSKYDVTSIMLDAKLSLSRGDARRAIEQGGVRVDGVVIKVATYEVQPGSVLQKGKTKFVHIL